MGMKHGPFANCDGLDVSELEDMEVDFRNYLSRENPFTPLSSTSVESNQKKRVNYDQNFYDPRYVHFLKHLKEHSKSYRLEYEENGVRVKHKYEHDLNVGEESDVIVEFVRKSRGAAKNINKASYSSEMGKKQANKSKGSDNVEPRYECVPDDDYDLFLQNFKTSKCGDVFKFGGHEVWYEGGRKKNVGKKDNPVPVVESIDPDTFYKKRTPRFSKESLKDEEDDDDNETEFRYGSSSESEEENSENNESESELEETTDFRQEVMANLRKPYNKEEHERLLKAVKHHGQEGRHLDLRNGREISYKIEKKGKSYLEYYPVFKRKLAQVQHDKLKCLNLLRGFFLFLQQCKPPFRPWEDEECCAITAGGSKRDGDFRHNPAGTSKTWRRPN